MIGIYKITSPSNKVYIGQSVNIEKRFIGYKRMYVKNKKQIKLHRSFLKYGVVNHIFEIVQECLEQELNNYERYYQELNDCLNNGLNCVLTKTNDKSGKVSIETLKKMSEASMGNQNWLGKKHTQETIEKIRLLKTGVVYSEETRRKVSESNKGRVVSPETRRKIGDASKGRTHMKGKRLSDETKKKISEAGKGNKNASKNPNVSEEERKKRSEASKERWRKYRISKGLDPEKPIDKRYE